jgi:hypothetical protein
MTSPPAAPPDLQGAQRPRVCSYPDYVSSAGDEAVDLARMAGLILDPWQQFVLRHSLGERADGKWAAFEVGLDVPRQNGKDSTLEARELAGLFLLGERLITHSAHQFDTSLEHFFRLLFLIENTPEFSRRVKRVSRSHGEEGIELTNRQRIRFRTRTKGGGRGFTGDLLILNEAMELAESAMGALFFTLSARPNPQVWYAGSSVDQEVHENGIVFARVRERGVKGDDPALAYFEWSADCESPADVTAEMASDPSVWAQANPGLGIRIAPEHVEKERRSMGVRTFAVERLGIGDWPDTSEDAGRVISRADWEAIAERDESQRIANTPVFAVDVNPDQTWGAVSVAGRRADGLYQCAVIEHARGTGWIVDFCEVLQKQHRRSKFVIDRRGPAAEKIDDLRAAKVRLIEANTEDYGRACSGFVSAVSERRVRYPHPQPELDEALAGARKQTMGDAWKWSRRNSDTELSPLVSATLALWAAENAKGRARVVNLAEALANAET